ncbi:unnamed protein product [Phytophthora fragariaefolia]|uniref:Unnamed protein product n=1 Tax=Phytophthora fragariaefolia TaxID=1490495 RepID=A0A9W6YNY7_9STRA|nr:unnamed protein product [Phytophthora fragariaefolia]
MSSSNIQSDESQTESFITDRSHVFSFERAASEPVNHGSELQLLDDMHNETESAKASGIDEEYTEFRGLMEDIMSDVDEWESEKLFAKEKTMKESDTKDCAGAVVRESAMQRLREQRLADAIRAADTDENSESLPTDAATPLISKETPTKLKQAMLASLVPLMESQVEQAQGIQAVLREDMVLRRQQHEEILDMR